jgi:hypothetical protein
MATQCDEFKKLRLLQQSAEYRVGRYTSPGSEPILVNPSGKSLAKSLGSVVSEERLARLTLQAHVDSCEVCDQGKGRGTT